MSRRQRRKWQLVLFDEAAARSDEQAFNVTAGSRWRAGKPSHESAWRITRNSMRLTPNKN
jgi:ferric-dicitrate binding protein FerR (iron transport regulator)